MIGLAVSENAKDARRVAENLAAAQRYRLTKAYKIIEFETIIGHACIVAREGELVEKSDGLITCIYYPLSNTSFFEKPLEAEDLGKTLRDLDQFFSGAIIKKEGITLFRDHVGHMPLAYGKIGKTFAVALSRPALGSAARSLKPGHMLILDSSGLRTIRWYHPTPWAVDYSERGLAERLVNVAEKYFPDTVFIGFSGGLDSSILAYLADRAGKRVKGIAVALEGSSDHVWSQEAASLLDIELEIIEPSDEELLEAAVLLSGQLLEARLIDLSIGSIMFLSARRTQGPLVVGQGADELFGGYWKYERAFLEHGVERVAELMSEDIEEIHGKNLERDELAIALAGSQLLAPYLSRSIYEAARSIDPRLKLRIMNGRVIRKWILRRAAEILGVPEKIIERPKKAAQYSSGIQKKLRRILAGKR